jgi:two-component system KDP operon response regulator KdpE
MDTTILIIEDEQDFVYLLRRKLQEEGYRVLSACDGVQGVQVAQKQHPDLVLLDVMMPRMNGWETCRRIRELTDVPIILVTALGGDENTVRGLEMGADDYIVKPFSLVELSARIRAALRRYRQPFGAGPLVQVDNHLTVDRARRQALIDGEPVELSATEFKVLSCLLDNAGRILTHQSLLTQVWGWEYVDQTDYLKVYVHNLRKKIERDPKRPSYILTERGLGYRFQMPTLY